MDKEKKYQTGPNIKQARIDSNLTQVEIAKILDMTRQTFKNLEMGETDPRFHLLQKIAELTKKPLSSFYELSPLDEQEKERLINTSRNQGIIFACRKLAELFNDVELAQNLIQTIGITIDCGREKDAEKLRYLIERNNKK